MHDNQTAERISRLLSLYCNVVQRMLMEEAVEQAGDGLTVTQYCGLRFVALHPGACIRDLARGLHVSHPAAVKLAERLQARGLVQRTQAEDDQRRVCLHTTPAGERLWQKVRNKHWALVGRVLEALGKDQAREMAHVLTAFLRAALRDEEQVARICLYCGVEHDNGCPAGRIEQELTGHPRTGY